jgi:hypothetical protein
VTELLVRFDGTSGENAAALTDFVSAANDVDSLAVSVHPPGESAFEPGTVMRVVDEDAASQDELAGIVRRLMARSRWGSAFTILPADTL